MKNSHRITVLDNIEDKYNYGQLSYPTSLDDIRQFEEDSKIAVNMFCLDSNNKVITSQEGNVLHGRNEIVILLYIQDEEEEQGHCIYIFKKAANAHDDPCRL
jgi:hypothetical protein